MKYYLRFLMVFLLTAIGMNAYADGYSLSVSDLKITPGESKEIEVNLDNSGDITGLQCYISLPAYFSFQEVYDEDMEEDAYVHLISSRWAKTHAAMSNVDNGVLKIAIFSSRNAAAKGNSGAAFKFFVKASETLAPGDYNLSITDIHIVDIDGATNHDQSDFTFKATYSPSFSISASSANADMGSVDIQGGGETVEMGSPVTVTATPVNGYEFVNWTASGEEVSSNNPYSFTASQNIALLGNFKAKKYDVRFVLGNGSEDSVLSLEYGSQITKPEDPVRTGYTFAGWNPAFIEGVTVPIDGIVYTALWTINQYTITFDTDGGSEIAPITQDYNTAVTAPAAPTKTGYTFAGWDKEIPETMPAEDMTIKALWTINQYTITFDTDGGSEIAPITQDYNTAVTAPADPTKTGYTFAGWDKEIPETMPAENMTIKALWTINSYKLTYKVDGEVYKQYDIEYNAAITPEAAPEKEGHTFSGWSEIPATMPANDVEVTGTFTINQYKVTFIVDGEVVKEETLDFGAVITAPEDPTKVGHTFTGWNPAVDATVPSHDVTYTAQFTVNQYTITFNTDGGSEVASITQDYNTAVTAPADPTKTGYTFAGWDKEIPETMPAENMTIKALWTINSYKLTYKVDGEVYKQYDIEYNAAITPEAAPEKEGHTFSGWSEIPATMPANDVEVTGTFTVNQYKVTFISDGVVVKEETLDFGTAITAPEDPTKVGHTFTGWNPEVDATVPSHDVTYTAQFTVNQYTITFDTDGGNEVAPITQDYNTAVTAPAAPTKTGYTFAGWDKEIPETMPAEDMTIKALWTINSYKLTYKVDGEVYKQYDIEYNAAITPEAAPEKEGHTFSGWSEIPATMPANDVEVTGTFTINQYKVTFIVDGEIVKEETLDFGSAITAPVDPTKIGHTFTGWNPAVDTTVPSHDVTYTAQFTVNQYTITFDTDGGSEVAPITQDYNTAVTAPAAPTKTGYTFAGWDKEIPETMPAEDMTIKALWTINQYTITFDTDGGSEIAPITQDYNTAVTAPAAPSKTGYTFAGWDKEIPETMPAEDMTIKALWTINQYTITFDTDGGSEVAPITQDYNTAVTAPAAPTKTGYTFAGWDKEIPETMPAEDMTIKALWTINQYTITFDTDGGSEIAPITQDYNTAVTAPAAPTKTGYTFAGWDKEIPETMPAEDMTIKALWTINSYKLTYKVDGEVYKQYDIEYNAAITPETAPEKEGYTFSGWSEIPETMPANDVEVTGTFTVNQYKVTFISDGVVIKEETLDFGTAITAPEDPAKIGHTFTGWNPEIDATVPSHDVTYTAQFTVNQYTITFDTDGGSEIAPITQDYNTAVTAPAAPTKTGYTFAGWDKEIPETMPAEDMTIKALWTINQYTITFDTDGGSEIAPITQDYNTAVTVPAAPTKTGYTFAGWDKEIPETMPAEDMTIKALWTINSYKLTYKVDGEVYKQYDVEYNAAITPEAAPEKEGHTFSGWSEIPATMPANDVEVTGTFTINQYKVTFIVDGEVVKEETLDFGAAIIAPEDPTKVGHTFIGWHPAVDATVPAHDVTYEAMFEINTYKLTYYVDGEVYKEFEIEYGAEIVPEENPVKEGYDFSGWSEIPQFMPDHDVDVYGTFTISTGINNVKSESNNEKIYDLSGNRMTHTKKGINIINGKKILIR